MFSQSTPFNLKGAADQIDAQQPSIEQTSPQN
jgi:hypothetical protein